WPRTGPRGCPRRAAAGSARPPSARPAGPRRRTEPEPPAAEPADGETASSLSWGLAAAGDDGFVGPALALVVGPADRHLLAGLAPREAEMHEGVLRDRRPPLRRQHRLAGVGDRHGLYEMRGNQRAARVLALPGLHLVAHQHAYFHLVARHVRTDAHRIGH